MAEFCELCRLNTLVSAYQPDAEGGARVYVCSHCGLAQSHRGPAMERPSAPVCGQRENVKEARAPSTLALMRGHCDLSQPLSVLDVGAARGTFVREFLSLAPKASITAVEPNQGQAWACAFLDRSKVIAKPIEEAELPNAHFDVVHSCRTIEHLDAPQRVLADHWRALKPGGMLFIDSRNIGAIRDDGIVDEWFTSNYRSHFSAVTLSRMLTATGFDIVEPSNGNDRENILIAAMKGDRPAKHASNESLADPLEVFSARALISFYNSVRLKNLSVLSAVVAELTALAPRGLAICGSGRLLNSLVHHAGLDRSSFLFLSEAQSASKSLHQENSPGEWPEIQDAKPGVVVVMSDGHADEIAKSMARSRPGTEIIHYSELVFRAYGRLAA